MNISAASIIAAATGTHLDDSGYYLKHEKLGFTWDEAMLKRECVTHVVVYRGTPVAVLMLLPDYATGFNRLGHGNHDLCPGEILRLISQGKEKLQ